MNTINREARDIAMNIGIADRVECMAERDAFITLKDHKENFQNHPTCRLINPAKSEMGHVSKSILERIVSEVSLATKLNQWRSTSIVIDWFKNIPDNSRSRFIKFNICDFYPSISESLLDRSIAFARTYTTVSESDIAIIKHARKSLLFSKSGEWVKKTLVRWHHG